MQVDLETGFDDLSDQTRAYAIVDMIDTVQVIKSQQLTVLKASIVCINLAFFTNTRLHLIKDCTIIEKLRLNLTPTS